MYISILIRLILGYVRVELEGYYVEEFINECIKNKILIWNLKKERGVKLYFNIGIRDFKKISKPCKKTKCKVKIQKKKGLPFILFKYKKRKIFAILLIVICIFIYISSKYVWNIDIEIENNQELEGIEQDLEELGLVKGVNKKDIDTENIINQIRLKRDDISWMGIDIEGTNVIVKIVKSDEKPEIVDSSD